MHISNTFANQLKGFGIIEKVQGLFICLTCLLCKQFDYAGVFTLKKNRIGLHNLQRDVFYKLKIAVYDLLRGDTKLMIRFFPLKLIQCLFASIDTLKIKIDGIEHLIVCYAAFNDVVMLMRQPLTAGCDIIEPLSIIGWEKLAVYIRNIVCELEDIHDGRFPSSDKTLAIVACLLLQKGKIKPHSEIQMLARVVHIRFENNNIGCVIESHATFKTPFLFIKSTRSSTMYSREKVCNTS